MTTFEDDVEVFGDMLDSMYELSLDIEAIGEAIRSKYSGDRKENDHVQSLVEYAKQKVADHTEMLMFQRENARKRAVAIL